MLNLEGHIERVVKHGIFARLFGGIDRSSKLSFLSNTSCNYQCVCSTTLS